LAGTEQLNPGLESREGQLYYNNKPVTDHMEGVQLLFKATGCLPGTQHHKLLTCHAVSSGSSLECSICLEQEKFTSEQLMTKAMQAAGLDRFMVLQHQPNWWHGRVDYYFHTAQVVIQVDGPAHFVANPRTRVLAELLRDDLRCNEAAWRNGVKLMRIHHEDQMNDVWRVHLVEMVLAEGPLLVLSPSYSYVNWKQQQGAATVLKYVQYMHAVLPGCTHSYGLQQYSWLRPPTL